MADILEERVDARITVEREVEAGRKSLARVPEGVEVLGLVGHCAVEKHLVVAIFYFVAERVGIGLELYVDQDPDRLPLRRELVRRFHERRHLRDGKRELERTRGGSCGELAGSIRSLLPSYAIVPEMPPGGFKIGGSLCGAAQIFLR